MAVVHLLPKESERLILIVENILRQYGSVETLPREEFILLNILRKLVMANQATADTTQDEAADVVASVAPAE